jgi:hypothetical protein
MLLVVASTLIAGFGVGGDPVERVIAQEATPVVTGASALERTDIRYLLPYTPDGLNPALTVAGNETGDCVESAAAADRPDAWRCLSGGPLDPCFENPFGASETPIELACLSSPWSSEVVLFTATTPLPREKEPADFMAAPPWALELANGEQCAVITGATAIFAGMRLNYGCTGQGAVIGEPDRGQPIWTVDYLPENGLATERVAVTVAWT